MKLSERSLLDAISRRMLAPVGILAADVSIPASTAVGVLGRLVQRGRIYRREVVNGRRGRPSYLYGIKLSQPLIAMNWDGSQLAGAVFSPDLTPLALGTIGMPTAKTVAAAAVLAAELAASLLARSGLSSGAISRLALSVNAIPLPGGGLRSSVLPWVNDKIAAVFEKQLGLPTRLVAHPGLLAEYRLLADSAPPSIVYLHAGDGVSGRFTAFGQPYLGPHQWAGQLGHVTVDPSGPRCGCGRRGCLETYCNGSAILRAARELAKRRGSPSWLRSGAKRQSLRLFIEEIWSRWQAGDETAWALMAAPLDRLSWGLGLLINLLDPPLIVVGGYLLQGRMAWIEELNRRCRIWVLDGKLREIVICSGRAETADYLRTTALMSEGEARLATTKGSR